MDPILRDTLFADLTDRDIVEAVICEMRRRGLYGCIFLTPMAAGPAAFGCSSSAGTLGDFTAAQQLAIFSEVASRAVNEKAARLSDDTDISFDPNDYDPPKWVN